MVAVVSEIHKKADNPIEPSSSASNSLEKAKSAGGAPGHRVPLPLGPNRLAYIELPSDWDKKELRKLIKLLEISLGDDEEGAKN
jgi:hypothetical protein